MFAPLIVASVVPDRLQRPQNPDTSPVAKDQGAGGEGGALGLQFGGIGLTIIYGGRDHKMGCGGDSGKRKV